MIRHIEILEVCAKRRVICAGRFRVSKEILGRCRNGIAAIPDKQILCDRLAQNQHVVVLTLEVRKRSKTARLYCGRWSKVDVQVHWRSFVFVVAKQIRLFAITKQYDKLRSSKRHFLSPINISCAYMEKEPT